MNNTIFERNPMPYFMTIPWNMAEVGKCLNLNWIDLNNDQKNVAYVMKDAKAHGVILEPEYSSQGIRFWVKEIRESKIIVELDKRQCIYDILSKLDHPKTITNISRNTGGTVLEKASRPELTKILHKMFLDGYLTEEDHQAEGGGRPTKRYDIK